MDFLGLTYAEYSDGEREALVQQRPREPQFKHEIIQAFYEGIKSKPESTFGNVKTDVLALKFAAFQRTNFGGVIFNSPSPGGILRVRRVFVLIDEFTADEAGDHSTSILRASHGPLPRRGSFATLTT